MEAAEASAAGGTPDGVTPEQARWNENWEEVVGGKPPTGRRLSVQNVSTEDVPRGIKAGQLVELRVVAMIRANGAVLKTDSKTDQIVDSIQALTGVAKSVSFVRSLESV